MLILPSVGATVQRIILNESATKAKIIYDDGSTTIVSTNNTPTKKVVKKVTKTPVGTTKVVTKRSVATEAKGMPAFKKVNTSAGTINVLPNAASQAVLESKRISALERAKKRAEMLGEQNMSASERLGLSAEEGSAIEL
jgi:hypothetical protein